MPCIGLWNPNGGPPLPDNRIRIVINYDAPYPKGYGTYRGPVCCNQAKEVRCVCRLATECPEHGETHNGSHD